MTKKTTRSTRKTVLTRKAVPTPTPPFTDMSRWRVGREPGRDMKDAYEKGTLTALSYKPGEVFLGAFSEADRLGFSEPITRSLFVTGYLQNLPNPVIMNDDGTIMKIGRVRDPAE